MTTTVRFPIGAGVSTSEGGVCGDLVRVVVDPIARIVTHLVVEPKHRQGLGRLVPIDLVDVGGDGVRLSCDAAAFDALEEAEEMQFLPGTGMGLGYGPEEVWGRPYYGLALGYDAGLGLGSVPQAVVYDRIPIGEIEIRRGEPVQATDGDVGKVQGVVIDPADHHMTHLLLQEGHLWGKKDVAIPIGAVVSVEDGIVLSLSKEELGALPAISLDPSEAA